MVPLMDSARDDVVLAEKKLKEKVPLMIEPLSILKSKNNNSSCISCSYRLLGTK